VRTFFDSSAFAKGYLEEPGSDSVERSLSQATAVGVAVTLVPEVVSAFCRLRRNGVWSRADYRRMRTFMLEDVADLNIVQLNEDVVGQAVEVLERNDLRAMDAIHVASALAWRSDVFVSGDRRQLTAAKREGLTIVAV